MVLKCATIISSTSESSHIISGPGSKVGWGWLKPRIFGENLGGDRYRPETDFFRSNGPEKQIRTPRPKSRSKKIYLWLLSTSSRRLLTNGRPTNQPTNQPTYQPTNQPTNQSTNHGVSSIKHWFPQWRIGWKVRILSIHFLLTVTYPGNSRFGIRSRKSNLRINV